MPPIIARKDKKMPAPRTELKPWDGDPGFLDQVQISLEREGGNPPFVPYAVVHSFQFVTLAGYLILTCGEIYTVSRSVADTLMSITIPGFHWWISNPMEGTGRESTPSTA